jgi:hypothetical protein
LIARRRAPYLLGDMRAARIDALLAAFAVAAFAAAIACGWAFVAARSDAAKWERRAVAASKDADALLLAAETARATSASAAAPPTALPETRPPVAADVEAAVAKARREAEAAAAASVESARAAAARATAEKDALSEKIGSLERALSDRAEASAASTTRKADAAPWDRSVQRTIDAGRALDAALRAPTLEEAADRLARADAWAEPLLDRAATPGDGGVRAVELLATLPSTTGARMAEAARIASRVDRTFVDAIGFAWAAVLKREGEAGAAALVQAIAAPTSPTRLAALAAACEANRPDAIAQVGAATRFGDDERRFAIERLPRLGVEGRMALLIAATKPDAPSAFRRAAFEALLQAATADDASVVARAVAGFDEGVDLASSAPVADAVAPFLTAALVDRAYRFEPARIVAARRLGADESASPRAVVLAAFGDRAVVAALGALGRDARPTPPVTDDEARALSRDPAPSELRDLEAYADARAKEAPELAFDLYAAAARKGHPGAVAALRRATLAEDPIVRSIAAGRAASVVDLSDDVARLVDDEDEVVRFSAAAALSKERVVLSPEVAAPLLRSAREGGPAEALVDAIERGERRDASLAAFLDALEDGAVRAPFVAAEAVVRLARPSGFRVLEALTSHVAPAVRALALEALDPRDAAEAARVSAIVDRAASDPEVVVRTRAARRLGNATDDLSRARLVQMTADPSPFVRAAAAWALSGREREKAVPAMRRAAEDPDPDVAVVGRAALLVAGVVDAPEKLVEALNDPFAAGVARLALQTYLGKFEDASEAERLLSTRGGAADGGR